MSMEAFLFVTDIPGECVDAGYPDWISILSYSHGVAQPGAGSIDGSGSLTGGRCEHREFNVTHHIDKASPKLALACCNGTHIPEIKLHLCRAGKGQQNYMEYILKDSIITSVDIGGDKGSNDLPTENIVFRYGLIEWHYKILDSKTGQLSDNSDALWNLHDNTGG